METTKVTPKNVGKKQLFENPILERLTRTHISIPLIIFNVGGIAMIYYGITNGLINAVEVIISYVIGVLAFSLVEYLMHRYVFHMEPTNKVKANIQYKFHGVHHEYPKDKERLAMPPVVSIVLVCILFLLFRLVMGNLVFGFLPGFLFGYTAYLWVHYIVHAFRPPSNIFKVLWVHHGIHHYKDNERAFGVSSPLWDFIFRTMPREG
ncbi:sterol desaturase family protein [Flexithrix dorotheae]|uniref:sterol desaturase family protein n=1 Tax=Flexithrix dorotheae TaxID=70993 RepID=UPI00036FE56E|nr:sterol desaturase family protein [Flexithrix dorotheae]